MEQPARSRARRGGSNSFADGGDNLSSDPLSAVELLRRMGALAKIGVSPRIQKG